MSVDQHPNRPDPGTPGEKSGRHRIEPGTALPGFPPVGATRTAYTVEAILERNGLEVPAEIRRDR